MNIFFMRHGEATDNVKGLISDKEIYWSILTDKGKIDVKNTLNNINSDIDIMYVSPFPRTIETAYYVYKKFPNLEIIIDNRIREIYYGKYSHCKNNEELDNIRKKQIEGDYFIRFGDYGENKYDIELRLCEFLKDIYESKKENVLIISHGAVIAYIKRILEIKSVHIKKGKMERFDNIDFNILFKHNEILENIKENYKL